MKQFSELNLDNRILESLEFHGYQTPTEIQANTIPLILTGQDVIGATETGGGKTAAFVLPALQLLTQNRKQPKAKILILTPTRELANQITVAIQKYGKQLKLTVAKIIGGVPYREQERMLSRPLDIIVATPGRLIDHLRKNQVNLSMIQMFVLDEADRMLDMGFIDDVKLIANSMTQKKQTLLFTATLDPRLIKSTGHLLSKPITIDLSKAKKIPEQITQQLFIANNHQQKLDFLGNLLAEENIFKGIIFSATKLGADKIAYHLRNQGHQALALHGDLKQRERKKSIDKLTDGKIQFLVATDVASRGIDIKNITHVINFDFPKCSDDYIHRVGRTGRAGEKGMAITIVLNEEKKYITSLEKRVGMQLQLININREFIDRKEIEQEKKHPKRKYNNKNNKRPRNSAKKPQSWKQGFSAH